MLFVPFFLRIGAHMTYIEIPYKKIFMTKRKIKVFKYNVHVFHITTWEIIKVHMKFVKPALEPGSRPRRRS